MELQKWGEKRRRKKNAKVVTGRQWSSWHSWHNRKGKNASRKSVLDSLFICCVISPNPESYKMNDKNLKKTKQNKSKKKKKEKRRFNFHRKSSIYSAEELGP